MSHFILAQIIGSIGVILFLISFQIKSNRILYLMQGLGSACFGIQFFLVGAISGCVSMGLLLIRNALLMKISDWKWVQWKGWIVIFTIACGSITVLTWAGWISLLPLIAMSVSNVVLWTNNARTIRIGNLFCISPAWLLYDIIVGAFAGVLNESIVMISVIVSIYRFGWKALGEDPKFRE